MLTQKRWYVLIPVAVVIVLVSIQGATAQNWVAMPPYNVLWPLYTPFYSPPDPITGVPTPLVTQLTSSTVLPVQPVMAWDPTLPKLGWAMLGTIPPWLLYNGPTGLVFFDTLYGINPWPPASYLDSVTGVPAPITLLPGYSLLSTASAVLGIVQATYLYDLGNLYYMLAYGYNLGINPASLVTAAQAFGLPIL
ncbi:MAG: hypothetical protein ACMUIS_03850 [bacterium]